MVGCDDLLVSAVPNVMAQSIESLIRSRNKLAFVFPGVGSEYAGMGRYVIDNFPCARETFAEVSDCAGRDMAGLCLSPEDTGRLSELANAKLAILTVTVASSRVLKQEFGIAPDYSAGHSVGEYAALCCAGVLSLRDTVSLLERRAEVIETALREVSGTMAWVINLDGVTVEEKAARLRDEGHSIYVSGYDCPRQTSISATLNSFQHCVGEFERAGAIVVPINATGPFHSPLMAQASDDFRDVLAGYSFALPQCVALANHSARPYSGSQEESRDNLALHLVKPVQWRDTTEFLLANDVRYALELGPNEIVGYLLGKTTKEISCLSLDREKQWSAFRSRWTIDEGAVISMIGKCLGAISSTRNDSRDLNAFEAEVAAPSRALRSLLERLKSETSQISASHLETAIETTIGILESKQVPQRDIGARLSRILGPRVIALGQGVVTTDG